MTDANPLRKLVRLVTSHNAEGKAVFSDAVGDHADPKPVDSGRAVFGLQYCSDEFPVDLNKEKDIDAYQNYAAQPPGLVISTGTVVRTVDMSPGLYSPMHRTVSLDYGIVLDGEVELILDSGEKRIMKPGDVAVQRGTMHAWRNTSDTNWARMIYVLTPAKSLHIEGRALGEDLDTMEGVRSST